MLDSACDAGIQRTAESLEQLRPYLMEIKARLSAQGRRSDLKDTPNLTWTEWKDSKREKLGMASRTIDLFLSTGSTTYPKLPAPNAESETSLNWQLESLNNDLSHIEDETLAPSTIAKAGALISQLQELVTTASEASGETATRIVASTSNEWYTPKAYIEAARMLMGSIDLDPASCKKANKVVKADRIYTAFDSGLEKVWEGKVWLNPPYGNLGGQFVAKLCQEFESGNVKEAVLLVNANCTDTKWFQPLFNYPLCFTDHRIDFWNETENDSSSTHGSVFVYFGQNKTTFAELFSQFGNVIRDSSDIGYASRGEGETNDWLTPPELVERLGVFDLDPCAAPEPKAFLHAMENWNLSDKDGLEHPWFGRVWLNPPYGRDTQNWIQKLSEYGDGLLLVFDNAGTEYWQNFVWSKASAVLFLSGHIKFYKPDGTQSEQGAAYPSALIAYGEQNVQALRESGLAGILMLLPAERLEGTKAGDLA